MKHIAYIIAALAIFACPAGIRAETITIDGVEYDCRDGVCMPKENANETPLADTLTADPKRRVATVGENESVRYLEGYAGTKNFIAFLDGNSKTSAGKFSADTPILILLLSAFIAGLAMNLTPCVLPMIPVTLIIIGKSARSGAAYGLGMTLSYGALGLAAAFGSLAFGVIQSSPWFNLAIALIFLTLAAALAGVFHIDFSKTRNPTPYTEKAPKPFYAFCAGCLAALLAGACIAPLLVAVLVLTADLFAKGSFAAVLLPFAMGAGMGAPWPLAGAGMNVLPRPGAWMKWVNRAFAFAVALFALHYARLAVNGFFTGAETKAIKDGEIRMTPKTFSLENIKRPILIDCWASWCKNCAAMDKILDDKRVSEKLKGFTLIKLQAEDFAELKTVDIFKNVKGLPTFAIVGEKDTKQKE